MRWSETLGHQMLYHGKPTSPVINYIGRPSEGEGWRLRGGKYQFAAAERAAPDSFPPLRNPGDVVQAGPRPI